MLMQTCAIRTGALCEAINKHPFQRTHLRVATHCISLNDAGALPLQSTPMQAEGYQNPQLPLN
jgi:hypothetical protein